MTLSFESQNNLQIIPGYIYPFHKGSDSLYPGFIV